MAPLSLLTLITGSLSGRSNDNGVTFGPVLTLAANGTLDEVTEEEEG
ncbi:MAG: hypothetical protein WA941_12145 [Nitrososphaeraceae archaeon]